MGFSITVYWRAVIYKNKIGDKLLNNIGVCSEENIYILISHMKKLIYINGLIRIKSVNQEGGIVWRQGEPIHR